MDLQRYNERHDLVLSTIFKTIKPLLPKSVSSTVDLDDKYTFPSHIVSTDLRPDMVRWDDTKRCVCLTLCFDTLFHDTATRKESKYLDLTSTLQQAGYNAKLITVEVGSRGLPNAQGFMRLKEELSLTTAQLNDLMVRSARQAIIGSHKVWCTRNRRNILSCLFVCSSRVYMYFVLLYVIFILRLHLAVIPGNCAAQSSCAQTT